MTLVNECFQCGLCTSICPKRRVSKYSPRLKITKFQQTNQRQVSWKCLTCGLCSRYCPQDVNYLNFVQNLREQEANEDAIAHKSVFSLTSQIMSASENTNVVPMKFGGELNKESDIAYFPGCIDLLDCFLDVGTNFHEIGEASIRLLNEIGVKPRVLSLKCCGHDALWQGDNVTFDALRRQNETQIRDSGIKTLVTSCAECARTFSMNYKLPVETLHISQLLAANIEKLGFKMQEGAATYHDPCRLGRHMGIYEAPREVLSAIKNLTFKELEDNKENAQCCGVSAWLSCGPEAKYLLMEKLEAAASVGAETLITACPKCLAHLSCVKNEKPPAQSFTVNIEDLTVFLARLIDE